MIDLNNVTLFSVDCKYYEKTILAINECLKNFSFKEVLFLSDKKPTNLPGNVKFIKIRSIVSLEDYSSFMINELPDFINTEFCLSVHYDGWIINENNWRPEFLLIQNFVYPCTTMVGLLMKIIGDQSFY